MKNFSKAVGVLIFIAVCSTALQASPSPWDSWRAGYINFEKGEQEFERGNYTAALTMFERAIKNYRSVRASRPDWNQRVIAERIAECDRNIKEVKRLLSSVSRGGGAAPAATPDSSVKTKPVPQTGKNGTAGPEKRTPDDQTAATAVQETDSAAVLEMRSTLERMRKELEQSRKDAIALRTELLKAQGEVSTLKKDSSAQRNFEQEISKLVRDRRIAQEKYDLLAARCKNLEAEISKPNTMLEALKKRLVEERTLYEQELKRSADLNSQLKELEALSRENRLARSAAEKVIVQLKQTVNEQNSELQLIKQQLEESKNKNQELAGELERSRKHSDELAQAMKKGSASANAAAAAITAELRNNIAERDRRISGFEKKIAELNISSAALKAKLRQDEQQIDSMKKEFERGRDALRKSMNEADKLRKQNAALSADIKQLSERSSELNKRLETRDSEDFRNAAAARETCRKLEKDILTLQAELVTVRESANSGNTRIADLERKLKTADAELQNVRNRELAVTAAKEQQSVELARLKKTADEFAELKRNFDALTRENRENRVLLAAAKPKEQELARVKLRLLELDRLKTALAQEQQLNEELRNETRRLTAEVKNLRSRSSELDNAKRKMAEFQGILRELAELKRVQSDCVRHIGQLEPQLAAMKIRSGELETQLKERQAQLEQLQKQYDSLTGEYSAQKKELAAFQTVKKRNSELNALISSQVSEIERLNSLLKKLQNGEESVMPAEYRRQLDELRRTAAKLAPLNDQLTRLQTQYEQMKRQFLDRIDKLNTRCEAAEAFSERRRQELARLRKLNAELVEMNKNSTNALKNKADKAQLDRLSAEITAMNKLYAEVTAERDRLNSELDAMRRGITPESTPVKITESPEEFASAGLVAEQNGNIQLAIWNYKQALLADSNFRSAHLRLGDLLYAKGDYAGALPHLSAAGSSGKFNLDLSIKTARCQIALKRYGNARNIIDRLLKTYSNDYRVQLLAGLIESGVGTISAAEERLITASRLAPDKPEVCIELARLLANSITDRKGEAVKYYETARDLGSEPVPDLEKQLASLLDNRREMIRFLSGAATEAELGRDYGSAVWYYRKLVELKPEDFIPRLALALHRSNRSAAARETLEFNKPTRLGMAVLTIIELDGKNESAALNAARQSAGARIPEDWQALNMEISKLKSLKIAPAAVSILLSGFQK